MVVCQPPKRREFFKMTGKTAQTRRLTERPASTLKKQLSSPPIATEANKLRLPMSGPSQAWLGSGSD